MSSRNVHLMPYERLFRSPRKPWVVGELRAEHAIEVLCLQCRRRALIAPHVVIARYKLSTGLSVVKLRCSRCRSDRVQWQMVAARPPGGDRWY